MKKSLDEMISVMQASKTKEIEFATAGQDDWTWCRMPPAWNWALCDYRVRAQTPRRIWAAHYNGKTFVLDVPDSTLSNAAEYVELTPDVKAKLGLT